MANRRELLTLTLVRYQRPIPRWLFGRGLVDKFGPYRWGLNITKRVVLLVELWWLREETYGSYS